MHFPTSLPPTSGSPAAKLVFEHSNSPHPESFDGPLPSSSTPGFIRTKLPLRPRPTAPTFVRLAGPTFPPPKYPPLIPPRPAARKSMPEYKMPNFSLPSPSANSEAMPASLTTAKLKMKGGLPSERLIKARNSWKRKRKARLDGARKPDLMETFDNLDGPFRTEFENAKEDAERSVSLVTVNSRQKLKRIFAIAQEGDSRGIEKLELESTQSMLPKDNHEPTYPNQLERSHPSKTGNDGRSSEKARRKMTLAGPRERLMAVRASREEDKDDFEEKLKFKDPDDPLGTEKHRVDRQMKKLSLSNFKERHDSRHDRRASEKDAHLFQAQALPDKNPSEYHKFTKSAKRRIHMAKEELQAYRSSIADDIHDAKETSGTRIFNAVRTAKAHFEMREAEKQARTRMAQDVSRLSERPRHPSASPREPIFSSPLYNGNVSSSNPSLSTPGLPSAGGYSPPSPKALGSSFLYNVPPEPIPRNRAYQQVFPARPSISYRPTLSPVYSKSPIPTNSSSQLATTSPKPQKAPLSGPVPPPANSSDEMVPASVILGQSKSSSGSSLSPKTEVRGRDFAGNLSLPPISTKNLQSGNEITNINSRKKQPYEHLRRSLVVEEDIPPLKLPSPEVKPAKPTQRLSRKPINTKSSSPETQKTFTLQNTKIDPPLTPNPNRIHKHIHQNLESSKTPTSSALEFWAAADASLAPSESASVQPPNRTGEPPPDIWRDADRTLNCQKGKPTLEEWIANLPGLGLRQGPLVASETLDVQMLKELRAKSIKQLSSKHNKEAAIAVLNEKLKKMEDEILEKDEEFVPEDEVGLTADEVKALEDDEPTPENSAPLVIDPSLLHPEYHPSPSPSMILELMRSPPDSAADELQIPAKFQSHDLAEVLTNEPHRPKSPPLSYRLQRPRDLAGNVTTRLDTLEQYWDEQGIIVGTVLKRMLWIVDTMIVKEREEAQKLMRKKEMGWMDEDGDDEKEDEEDEESKSE